MPSQNIRCYTDPYDNYRRSNDYSPGYYSRYCIIRGATHVLEATMTQSGEGHILL